MRTSRPWSGDAPEHPLVVGVEPDQTPQVPTRAAEIAATMGTGLLCTWVDGTQIAASEGLVGIDGTLPTVPLDPDRADDDDTVELLVARLTGVLAPTGVPWALEYRIGEVTRGLAVAAAEHGASMIVVGTRRPGFGGWMNELIGGSVAGHLAHTQDVPVLVIPAKHDGAR
ncbi:universal stress protein [Occultella glacieicola]|uniref:Universal stress protein n=1 Tax=Occultella glacieicola TaxID=2518684 RepID=A0ABY2DXF3_9MICO|nr:universal stress protein [Occultella glacieicola]TDE88816.1 universal stress protein [Occultella glacieicola]